MTIPIEIRKDGEELDAETSSARVNARLDETTAEMREAWRTAAMRRIPRPRHAITEKHVFVAVPPLHGLSEFAHPGNCCNHSTDSYGAGASPTSRTSETRNAAGTVVGYSISAQPLYQHHQQQR
ncbi:hypothetical protein PLEOSDRAFT_1080198 [Pleurotus ostreatus PC15]|uniref:Uncharacterized protein n=1 Tax=Pleurotus ostreatus (strain PC15) TaxID=1137138 RepID=A0A067P097_PLEO1|nr:hypothetical protein PLEOSDRAFT_1080198 [Pleurotus ostreatus PC15]